MRAAVVMLAFFGLLPYTAWGQRARFPSTDPMPPSNLGGQALTPYPNMVPLGQTAQAPAYPQQGYPSTSYPAPAPAFTPPRANLGVPSLNTFDPYATQPPAGGSLLPSNSSSAPPALFPNSPLNRSIFGSGAVAGTPTGYPSAYGSGSTLPPVSPSPGYAPPEALYPSAVYPNSTPPALFPNGYLGAGSGVVPGNLGGYTDALGMPEAFRLIQGPRLRQTYVSGGDGTDEVGIDDTETSVAVTIPSFLWSTQPLYILPSFGLHLFDGPESPLFGADLPAAVYDAFVAAGWQSDPNQIFGAELGIATGVFTDFDTISSDSLRIMGSGLAKVRITPTATLKVGAMYIDRNNVKLIPAGGLLWQPTPYTRFDIFFPSPKAARYLTTLGTQDIWGYVSGEYGGGTWTIERANGDKDSIDLNDFRVMLGLEWGLSELLRSGKRIGFVEGGYIFERELKYKLNPGDDIDLKEAFMVRAGIGY